MQRSVNFKVSSSETQNEGEQKLIAALQGNAERKPFSTMRCCVDVRAGGINQSYIKAWLSRTDVMRRIYSN